MSKSEDTIPEKYVKAYDELIAALGEVERKGKAMPYTSLNGNMFSFLSKEGAMGLRLSGADREAFMREFNTGLMQQHGSIMKEYVEVPPHLLEKTDVLSVYFRLSYRYASTLKPKPTKKEVK